MGRPQPLDVAELLVLDPSSIDPDWVNRIGLYFPAKAEALGVLMARDGQNDPIKIVPAKPSSQFDWRLVTGLHRLNGCISANLNVAAFVMSSADDLRSMQASENMDRRELDPIERALFINAVAEQAKARLIAEHGDVRQQVLAGKARAAKVQYSDLQKADEASKAAVDNLSIAYSWKAETAEACGYSPKDVQRSMRIYRCVVEPNRDLIDAFKDLDVAKSADVLLKIAALKDGTLRRKVIETLIAGPKDLTMAMEMAGVKSGKPEQSPYYKNSSQVFNGASKIGVADWKRFCPEFAKAMRPAQRVELRDALNAAIDGQQDGSE